MACPVESLKILKHRNCSITSFGRFTGRKYMILERGTIEKFHEVGPHVRFHPKSLWIEAFYRNFIRILGSHSFVPKGHTGNFQ